MSSRSGTPGIPPRSGRATAPSRRTTTPAGAGSSRPRCRMELRALGDEVRAADWPVRLAFRSSRTALLDTLCRWQTLRALAYLHLLAARTGTSGCRPT